MSEDVNDTQAAAQPAENIPETSAPVETDSSSGLGIKAPEPPKESGFSYKDLQKEYETTGTISDATKEKLKKSGFDDDSINDYITAKEAQREVAVNKIAESVGGRENFNKIIEWAGKNLPKEEIEEINAIRSGYAQRMILKDLQKRMEAKEGVQGKRVKGDGVSGTDEIFESQAQMLKALQSKDYATDPAYRAKVAKKIAASRKAGINLGY